MATLVAAASKAAAEIRKALIECGFARAEGGADGSMTIEGFPTKDG